jgi:transposase InsO family protein
MAEVELPKSTDALSAEVLFRYCVIAFVLARETIGDTRAEAIDDALDEPHLTVTGRVRAFSRRSVYRWLAAFARGGIPALEPAKREASSSVLSPAFLVALCDQKGKDPLASIPEIIRRARELGALGVDEPVHRVTAYRAAKRLGLPLTGRVAKRHSDMRRFAFPHRMRMVLVDGKHFRAGAGRLKRVAFFFIDDCTRRIVGVVVGPSESTLLLLRGLLSVIRHFGLMDVLYFDRGPGFISRDTHAVCANLGIHFIHGRKRYPEGHGKIEAFNKTAQHDVLRGLLRPEVDSDFGSLELRITHYVEEQYNLRPHESLDLQSPAARWNADDRELRFPRDEQDLHRRFLVTHSRRVSADNVVSLRRVSYELPRGHAHSWVVLQRQTLDGSLWVPHDGKLVQVHPVDLAHNAEDRRAAPHAPGTVADAEAPVTAAALAFERDFGPVTLPTGNPARRSRKP